MSNYDNELDERFKRGEITAVEYLSNVETVPGIQQALLTTGAAKRDSEFGKLIPSSEPAPQTFSRVETIGGREVTVTAASEVELERKVTALIKDSMNHEPSDDADGRAVEQWSTATERFLNSSAGQNWPGGERNRELIGLTIQKLGLVDAEDKVAALTAAYEEMKRQSLIFDEGAVESVELDLSDMTPSQMIDAYKKSVEAQGQNLNEVFMRDFSKSGRAASGIFNR